MPKVANKTDRKSRTISTQSASQTHSMGENGIAISPPAYGISAADFQASQFAPETNTQIVQTKLKIGRPNDRYEQEADAVATQVVNGTPPQTAVSTLSTDFAAQRIPEEPEEEAVIQKAPLQTVSKPEEEKEEEKENGVIQRQIADTTSPTPTVSKTTAATINWPRTGQPLAPNIRQRIEPHVGANLNDVRVHQDNAAAQAANNLQARAFTHRNHIFLNRQESSQDLFLMSHEATHVVQQGGVAAVQPLLTTAAPPELQLLPSLLGDFLNDYAQQIPGYSLFTAVIRFNPLTGTRVNWPIERILHEFMRLIQMEEVYQALRESGIIQSAVRWVNGELERFDLSLDRLERTFEAARNDLELTGGFDDNLNVLKRHFGRLYSDAKGFAFSLVNKLVELIKDAALDSVEQLLAQNKAWALIKKVIKYDPLRGVPVNAPTAEILADFLRLIGREQELAEMEKQGTLEKTAAWLDTQLGTFLGLLGQLQNLFQAAWSAIQPENLPNLSQNLQSLAKQVDSFLGNVWDFASTVATKVLALIKDALLRQLRAYAAKTRGYALLTVILGRDVFTNQVVERTPTKLIRGFMELLMGDSEQFKQMEQTGIIAQAGQQVADLVGNLGISLPFVKQLFTDLWHSFTIEDLLNPISAFQRIMARFGEPLGRLFTFATEVIKIAIRLLLQAMNFPTDIIARILSNAAAAFADIQREPVGFLKNMLAALKQGFVNFFDKILDYLLDGVTDWLFAQIRKAGIEPPAELTLESVFDVVLQILDITTEKLWKKLADRIGQEKVDKIRGVIDKLTGIWNFIRDVQERGLTAVWDYIKEQLTGLWDKVLEEAQNWLMVQIVQKVSAKLLSMLDPTGIMAVINSFNAFFRAIQSAIEYIRELLTIVENFTATIASVARGDIQPGAAKVEEGLANSVPVAIGFLANQVGLGDLSTKLADMIQVVRALVDQALDWLIDKAVSVGDSLLTSLKTSIEKTLSFFGVRTKFDAGNGEKHSVYYEEKDGDVQLMVASTPRAIEEFLDFYESYNEIKPTSRKGNLIGEIRTYVTDTIKPQIEELDQADKNEEDTEILEQALLDTNVSVSTMLRTLLSSDSEVGQLADSYLLEGLTGTYGSMPKPKNDILTADHQPQASILIWAAEQPYFAENQEIQKRARGGHADGAYAINLYEDRHIAGRTYGDKGKKTKQQFITLAETELEKLPDSSNEKDQRQTVVSLMKDELAADVTAMRKIANKRNNHPIWADVYAIEGMGKDEKTKLVSQIRKNILDGEKQLEKQDFSALIR